LCLSRRDALLAATLDAAQTAAGRAIPVLSQPTSPGDVMVAHRAQAVAAPAVAAGTDLLLGWLQGMAKLPTAYFSRAPASLCIAFPGLQFSALSAKTYSVATVMRCAIGSD
jgi:hypothetical protein